MTKLGDSSRFSGRILLATTAICLFMGTQGASAGGGHSGDHGGMENHGSGMHEESFGMHESGGRGEGVKSQGFGMRDARTDKPDVVRDRARASQDNQLFRAREDRRKDAEQRTPAVNDNGKARNGGISAAAPGNAATNTIHPIVTNNAGQPPATGPASTGKNAGAGQSSPGAANNTIHPIVTNDPAHSAPNPPVVAGKLPPNDPVGNTHPTPGANPPVVAGKLPPNDPVGNTHPTPGANPPTVVTVSNGLTTTQIQNGPGGVAVYSDKPGTITVTNGKESTTLNGGSVTLSGDVVGVGHGQGIEVGPRNGEGKTVVAISPPAPAPAPAPPSHVTGGPEGGFFGDLGSSIKDGVKAAGNGLADGAATVGKGITDGLGLDTGFSAKPLPAPPPATSTIHQQ